LASMLPEDTIAYVSVRNAPDLLRKVRQLPIYAVIAKKDFLRGLAEPEAADEMVALYETYVEPLGGLLHGEAAFGLLSLDLEGDDPPAMVVLADVAGAEPALAKYLERVIYPWIDANEDLRRDTVQIGGTTITRTLDADTGEPAGAIGVRDGVLFVFPYYEGVGEFLAALDEPGRSSLADAERYVEVSEFLADADVGAYLNYGAVDRLARDHFGDEDPEGYYAWTWGRFLEIAGFRRIEAAGVGLTFGPEGCETKARCWGRGPHGGIFGVVAQDPKPLKSIKYIAGDASIYMAFNVGAEAATHAAALEILRQIDEGAVEHIQAVLQGDRDEEEKDMLAPFAGEIAGAAWALRKGIVPKAALMFELKEPKTGGELAEQVFERLRQRVDAEAESTTSTHEGVTIRSIEGLDSVVPSVAVVGDFLVVATEPGVIEGMVDTLAEGTHLGRSKAYTAYVTSIPGDAALTFYADTRSAHEAVVRYLVESAGVDMDEALRTLRGVAAYMAVGEALSPFGMKVLRNKDGVTARCRSANGAIGGAWVTLVTIDAWPFIFD